MCCPYVVSPSLTQKLISLRARFSHSHFFSFLSLSLSFPIFIQVLFSRKFSERIWLLIIQFNVITALNLVLNQSPRKSDSSLFLFHLFLSFFYSLSLSLSVSSLLPSVFEHNDSTLIHSPSFRMSSYCCHISFITKQSLTCFLCLTRIRKKMSLLFSFKLGLRKRSKKVGRESKLIRIRINESFLSFTNIVSHSLTLFLSLLFSALTFFFRKASLKWSSTHSLQIQSTTFSSPLFLLHLMIGSKVNGFQWLHGIFLYTNWVWLN